MNSAFQPPAYAYVPGCHPHPVSDPAGHSRRVTQAPLAPLAEEGLDDQPVFPEGIELFNRGYYWEAHESWERLWHAAGRAGALADFLKGLIKLAAAGVKAREGNEAGVIRHARRAAELLRSVAPRETAGRRLFSGVDLDPLIRCADDLAVRPVIDTTPSVAGLPVLGIQILLREDDFH